jgi:hypothetical protein
MIFNRLRDCGRQKKKITITRIKRNWVVAKVVEQVMIRHLELMEEVHDALLPLAEKREFI